VPSIVHEAPLYVLREAPALVPALLRECLGLTLPPFIDADLGDTGFTEVVPSEFRADLVVHLRGPAPDHVVAMGLVIEVQRARDEDKRRSWPLYVAALHARLRCPTALVVIATDEATARWAAVPIPTLQPGSPFAPLVIGPDRVPRVSRERAHDEPWMAVLSALVHANRPGGVDATLVALAALAQIPAVAANVCYDLIRSSLSEAARRSLEEAMESGKYEYQSDFARRYFGEGRHQGREEGRLDEARALLLTLAERHGPLTGELRARALQCPSLEDLRSAAIEIAEARDSTGVARVLIRLPRAT
jgi:hypothetical protein